jgi:hypothetical protein
MIKKKIWNLHLSSFQIHFTPFNYMWLSEKYFQDI